MYEHLQQLGNMSEYLLHRSVVGKVRYCWGNGRGGRHKGCYGNRLTGTHPEVRLAEQPGPAWLDNDWMCRGFSSLCMSHPSRLENVSSYADQQQSRNEILGGLVWEPWPGLLLHFPCPSYTVSARFGWDITWLTPDTEQGPTFKFRTPVFITHKLRKWKDIIIYQTLIQKDWVR